MTAKNTNISALRTDYFQPLKGQSEIDREIAAYRRAYRLSAVTTFLAVMLTVALIEIDPLRWVLQ